MKFKLLFLLCAGLLPVCAQLSQPIRFVNEDPSGAGGTGERMQYNVVNGTLWGCQDDDEDGDCTWAAIAPEAEAGGGLVYRGVFGSLPAAGDYTNALAIVTDCATYTCAAGSGSLNVLLQDTGSSWAIIFGEAAYKNIGTGSGDVAAGDRGVPNGPTHDHNGGDGGTIAHGNLSGIATLTHTQIEQLLPIAVVSSTGSDSFVATTSPALIGYNNAMARLFRPTGASCSGAATLNIDTLGAKSLFAPDGTSDPTCTQNRDHLIVYDSSLASAAGAFRVYLLDDPGGVSSLSCATGSGAPTTGAADSCYRDTSVSPAALWWFVAIDTPVLIPTSSGSGPVTFGGEAGDACPSDVPVGHYCLRSDGTRLIIEDENEVARQIPVTGDIQSGAPLTVISSTGSDTFTGGTTPALTAYTNGMHVHFRPTAASCSGAASLNIDSLGAKSLFASDGTSNPTCTQNRDHLLVYDAALASSAGAFRTYLLAEPGAGGSGPALTAAGTYYLPFGAVTGQLTSGTISLANPRYFGFSNPWSGGLKVTRATFMVFAGEGSKDINVGLYNSSGSLVAQATTKINALASSGANIDIDFPSPPTLTDSFYFIGIATNCTASTGCTIILNTTSGDNRWGQLLVSQTTKYACTGANAATQSGGAGNTIVMPSTIGACSAVSSAAGQPPVVAFFN